MNFYKKSSFLFSLSLASFLITAISYYLPFEYGLGALINFFFPCRQSGSPNLPNYDPTVPMTSFACEDIYNMTIFVFSILFGVLFLLLAVIFFLVKKRKTKARRN